ncbi:tyrosine-type recombinase/integrase [Mesorhizobium sp. CCNWLW176]
MPLTLFKRGGYWYLRGSVRGIQYYSSTKTADRDAADDVRILTEGRLLQESVFGKKAVKTFRDAADSYLAQGCSPRFVAALAVRFGNSKLHAIDQTDLDGAASSLFPNTTAATRNRQIYTPFIAIWNQATKNGWADVRKWQRPRKPKGTAVRSAPKRSGTEPVDYERAAQFVAKMSPAPAMVMTALFFTGLRPIELFALEASEVNVDGRWIVLQSTKTGEPRGVPMHEFLAPLFESLLKRKSLDKDARIFRTPRNKPYTEVQKGGGGLKSAILGARKRSGISDISLYTARHSVSTGLVIAGVHPHIKDQILGHAADDMSRHYTNVPQAPLIEAINKLPVPDAWRKLAWWQDPLAWSAKLVEGTGARNDLKGKRRD